MFITPAAHTNSPGVYIDSDLNFQHHIKNTVKMCNYFIRDIRRVRKHLTLDDSTALANALVSSALDHCNFLLHYIPIVRLIGRSEPARHMLGVPHYNYKQYKSFTHLSNSFFYSAPRLWNSLPETCRCAPSLGSFRARLKTYLWTKSFPP